VVRQRKENAQTRAFFFRARLARFFVLCFSSRSQAQKLEKSAGGHLWQQLPNFKKTLTPTFLRPLGKFGIKEVKNCRFSRAFGNSFVRSSLEMVDSTERVKRGYEVLMRGRVLSSGIPVPL
jgi:hypothetical protein